MGYRLLASPEPSWTHTEVHIRAILQESKRGLFHVSVSVSSWGAPRSHWLLCIWGVPDVIKSEGSLVRNRRGEHLGRPYMKLVAVCRTGCNTIAGVNGLRWSEADKECPAEPWWKIINFILPHWDNKEMQAQSHHNLEKDGVLNYLFLILQANRWSRDPIFPNLCHSPPALPLSLTHPSVTRCSLM